MTTYSWKNGTAGDWTVAANWQEGSIPSGADADVFIDATPTGNPNYNVTIPTGTNIIVHSLDLGSVDIGLVVDGTLTYAPGSSGVLGHEFAAGALAVNGGTIVNAGMVWSFIQTTGNVLFTGSNPIYLAFELQVLDGTATVDTATIGQYTAATNTLFDGIFEAMAGTSINLGGSGGGFKVDVERLTGVQPTPTHSYWTQLVFDNPGSQINEWTGTKYVPIESTLKLIDNAAFVTVTNGRDYTTANALTIGKDGVFEQAGGSLNTGGLTLLSGGLLVGGYSETGSNPSTGQVVVNGAVDNNGQIVSIGPGLVFRDAISGTGEMRFDRTVQWPGLGLGDPKPTTGTLEVGSVGSGQIVNMDGGDTLILDQPGNFAGTIAASGANNAVAFGGLAALTLSSSVGVAHVKVDPTSTLLVDAGVGADTIYAGGASTLVTGGSGSLFLVAGTGSVTVTGGTGAATVFGGAGGGSFEGGRSGQNVLVAGAGNTTLVGGGAGDVLVAGSGTSTLVLKADGVAFGGAGQSTMYGAENSTMVGSDHGEVMVAGAGPEALWAGTGTSVLHGGTGDDTLVGGVSGQATLVGGSGDNLFLGLGGKTVAQGGTGNDVFFAGSGDMTITEGNGADNVVFGTGNATVSAGKGTDLFTFLNGHAGGADVVSNFKVGADQVQLFGYDANAAQVHAGGGNTTVNLSDGTTITLLGVAQLAPNSIVS